MECKIHPGRPAAALCQKLGTGYCTECCECRDATECCGCADPKVYCQFRTQCLIWDQSRGRRRREAAPG